MFTRPHFDGSSRRSSWHDLGLTCCKYSAWAHCHMVLMVKPNVPHAAGPARYNEHEERASCFASVCVARTCSPKRSSVICNFPLVSRSEMARSKRLTVHCSAEFSMQHCIMNHYFNFSRSQCHQGGQQRQHAYSSMKIFFSDALKSLFRSRTWSHSILL